MCIRDRSCAYKTRKARPHAQCARSLNCAAPQTASELVPEAPERYVGGSVRADAESDDDGGP
eukprot:9354963-Alexandrium_andersonii.AAC.1